MLQCLGGAAARALVGSTSGQAVWTQFRDDALAWKAPRAKVDAYRDRAVLQRRRGRRLAENVDATLKLTTSQVIEQMLANIRGNVKASGRPSNAKLAEKLQADRCSPTRRSPSDSSSHFPADRHDAMTALFSAAHRLPRMRDVYREYYGHLGRQRRRHC